MTQVSDPAVADVPAAAPAESPPTRLDSFRRRRPLSHVSIQSKLIMMLVLCTILVAAVVGGIAYHAGRNALREAVFNRLTEVRQSRPGRCRPRSPI